MFFFKWPLKRNFRQGRVGEAELLKKTKALPLAKYLKVRFSSGANEDEIMFAVRWSRSKDENECKDIELEEVILNLELAILKSNM